MKTVCAFCKTEFVVRGQTGACPVCGRRVRVPKKSGTGKLFAAVAVFLCASVFAVASFRMFSMRQKSELLSVSVSDVKYTDAGYTVRGNIRNFSDNTYSVPDLRFVFKSDGGEILRIVVELPPSGLIEPKSDMEFIKTISPKIPGAQRISVGFAEVQ